MLNRVVALCVLSWLGFTLCDKSFGSIITLRSGNGSVGGTDSKISMLIGPLNGPFASAFTAADFNSARSGPAAHIVSPHPLWKPHLTSDPSAEWISTSATGASSGNSALYAIDFTISAGSISSATLDFDFLIDNDLGDLNGNEGLYINGVALSNSTLRTTQFAFFQNDQSFPQFDITSLVNPGLNTLYINAVDTGGPSGLQFSATINFAESPIPEPTTLGIWATLAGIGFVARRWRPIRKAAR